MPKILQSSATQKTLIPSSIFKAFPPTQIEISHLEKLWRNICSGNCDQIGHGGGKSYLIISSTTFFNALLSANGGTGNPMSHLWFLYCALQWHFTVVAREELAVAAGVAENRNGVVSEETASMFDLNTVSSTVQSI